LDKNTRQKVPRMGRSNSKTEQKGKGKRKFSNEFLTLRSIRGSIFSTVYDKQTLSILCFTFNKPFSKLNPFVFQICPQLIYRHFLFL